MVQLGFLDEQLDSSSPWAVVKDFLSARTIQIWLACSPRGRGSDPIAKDVKNETPATLKIQKKVYFITIYR